MKNKVKPFLDARGLSVYQFIKDTGIAPATGYKLAKNADYLPGIRVLEAVCDTYRVQPGELLEWVEDPPAPTPQRAGKRRKTADEIAAIRLEQVED